MSFTGHTRHEKQFPREALFSGSSDHTAPCLVSTFVERYCARAHTKSGGAETQQAQPCPQVDGIPAEGRFKVVSFMSLL